MSKRTRRNPEIPQTFLPRPLIKTRTQPPIPMPTKAGIELRCPFCADHHVLLPNVESPCGTRIEVTAVQEVISSRLAKKENLVCIKCFKGGGEMVRYRNSFIHAVECNPEARLLQDIPPNNLLARIVFSLHPKIRESVEKFTGIAQQVREINNEGKQTGKIVGYVFMKGIVNGKNPSAAA